MAIVPVAGPKRACGNRSRLVDFSPAIDRSLLARFSVLIRRTNREEHGNSPGERLGNHFNE
jgi:hypothetical protein